MSNPSPADIKFAIDKAPSIIEHLVTNLRSLGSVSRIERLSAPAVLICGAGPTLDLKRVKAASLAGISIWTVNTAAQAVCSVVAPDVVVVRESLDVSEHLHDLVHPPRLIALDVHAHPNVWKAAGEKGGWFIPASPHTFAICAGLDIAPVYGGTASLTAAVALASAGGAEWIGLEGVDLAYGRDGAGYAAGARYEAHIERVDGVNATIGGGVEQRELAERSGQAPPPSLAHVHLVHAREGGPLHASGPWLSQIEWLESFAARRPQMRDWWPQRSRGLGLADLVGWPQDERDWGDIACEAGNAVPVYGDWCAETSPVDPARLAAVFADIDRQCTHGLALADAVSRGGDPTLIADLVEGAALIDAHAAGQVMLASGSFEERLIATYAAHRASAERLRV